ncbi:hypothetical protein AB0N17_18380 [Streptomyces sp. NPDC051133]|uniref:hypothetical protein n=1 Tax=Streptomyces sp. NPDC051133 TaxID=3155521 RepID=UPI0034419EFE
MADRKRRQASPADVGAIAKTRTVAPRAAPRRLGRYGGHGFRPRDRSAPEHARLTGTGSASARRAAPRPAGDARSPEHFHPARRLHERHGVRSATGDAVGVFPVREPAVAVGEGCRTTSRSGDG